jgi:hypothetical protein
MRVSIRVPRLWAVACIALTTAAYNCDAGTPYINGCKVEANQGGWGDFYSDDNFRIGPIFNSYEDNQTTGCPIAIVQPGERVYGGTTMYDYSPVSNEVKFARKARLKFINSVNVDKFNSEFRHAYFDTYVREYELFGYYPAATGRGTLNDHDFMSIRVIDTCCLDRSAAYAELKLDYGGDANFRFSIAGSEIPLANSSHTWTVSSPSGGHPHSYTWSRGSTPVGSGSSYTGNAGGSDFAFRVDGTDAYGRTAASVMHVDVDGVRTTLSGPTLVYASQNGGTWTAMATGGYPPYSYEWFIDDVSMGIGSNTWDGYTGEHNHTLRVRLRDALGAVHDARLDVQGLGRGDGSCDPVPPQLTCSVDG